MVCGSTYCHESQIKGNWFVYAENSDDVSRNTLVSDRVVAKACSRLITVVNYYFLILK